MKLRGSFPASQQQGGDAHPWMGDETMFFFGPRQSWDDPFGLRRLDQDEDVGGPRRSLVENF